MKTSSTKFTFRNGGAISPKVQMGERIADYVVKNSNVLQILALGMVWQNATKYHLQRPPIDNVEPDVLAQCYPYSRCTLSAASLAPAPGPSIIVSSNASGFADSG